MKKKINLIFIVRESLYCFFSISCIYHMIPKLFKHFLCNLPNLYIILCQEYCLCACFLGRRRYGVCLYLCLFNLWFSHGKIYLKCRAFTCFAIAIDITAMLFYHPVYG